MTNETALAVHLRTTLLDLASRVQALAGPDRELDMLVWAALNGVTEITYPDKPQEFSKSGRIEGRDVDGKWILLGWIEPGKVQRNFTAYGGDPAYPFVTASIDAAMSLVVDGAGLTVSRYWIAASDGPVWSAEIATGGVPSNPRKVFDCYDAATAALAICVAALKARAAIADQSPEHRDPEGLDAKHASGGPERDAPNPFPPLPHVTERK